MEYLSRIQEALSEKLNGKEINENTVFKDLNMDSIDLVDLIMELEDELGIQFEDDELMSIKTVGDLLKVIDTKK